MGSFGGFPDKTSQWPSPLKATANSLKRVVSVHAVLQKRQQLWRRPRPPPVSRARLPRCVLCSREEESNGAALPWWSRARAWPWPPSAEAAETGVQAQSCRRCSPSLAECLLFIIQQSCLCPTSPHRGPAQPCAGQHALAAHCSAQHQAARSFHSP